jgi:hypothetical protein
MVENYECRRTNEIGKRHRIFPLGIGVSSMVFNAGIRATKDLKNAKEHDELYRRARVAQSFPLANGLTVDF